MQRERDFEAPSRAVTTRRGSRPGRGLVLTLAGAVLLTAATTWTFARLQAPIVTDVTTGAMASTNRTDFDRTNLHTVYAHATGTSSPVLVTGLPDFTGLVDQVGPSVVNIRTTEKVTPGARGGNSQN